MDFVPLFPLGLSDTFPGNKELPPLPHKLPGGKTKILLQSFHIQHYLQHIWCLGPCLRTWKINCSFFRACCTVCMAAWCGPCAETCGLYFSKVENRSSWLFTYMPPPIFYCLFHPHYCQAQFQLSNSVQVQLRTEISLIISVRPHPTYPPHPGKYI